MEDFLDSLINIGILRELKTGVIHENNSKEFQDKNQELFHIDESLIAQYFALIPEEFYFHSACKGFASKFR